MSLRFALRLALGWLTLFSLQIGLWALLAPQSFYDDFPGLGRSWVSGDGPFNEHLTRDVGALNLALAALFVFAAVRLSSDLLAASGIATIVWGVPHFLYHAFTADRLATGDSVMSLIGLGLFVAAGVLVIRSSRTVDRLQAVAGASS